MITRPYDRGHDDLLRIDSILPHIKVKDFTMFMHESESLAEEIQNDLYFQVQELVLSFHEGELLHNSPHQDICAYDRMYCIFNMWLSFQEIEEIDISLYHKSLINWRTQYVLNGMTKGEKEHMLKEIKQHQHDGKIERLEDETS